MRKQGSHERPDATSFLGLGGIFKGIGDLVERLGELAEKGEEMRREGTVEGGKGLKGVFGFTVKVGGLGKEEIHLEPFGNVRRDEAGRPTVSEEREPLVDVFDEEDRILVIAEVPGVDDAGARVELNGDLLLIAAEGPGRKYRKEVLLPRRFDATAMTRSFRNGVLEVSFSKGGR